VPGIILPFIGKFDAHGIYTVLVTRSHGFRGQNLYDLGSGLLFYFLTIWLQIW
jgi:hypothetical protein